MTDFLIVGAGIAGLTLAQTFKKQGISFDIIEKKAELTADGAGIALPANATLALKQLELAEPILSVAHRVTQIRYTKNNGKLLSSGSLMSAPLNKSEFIALERAKLLKVLANDIEPQIQFNTELTALSQKETEVEVVLNNEHRKNYQAVIGADGLNSVTRKFIFPEARTVDLRLTSWRWLVDSDTDGLEPTYMFGKTDVFMAYPIAADKVYCYAHVYDPKQQYFHKSKSYKSIKTLFKYYQNPAKDLIKQLPDNDSIIVGRSRSVAKPYYSKASVALIGDACSACSPILQQGAACAFEDVLALLDALANHDIPDALVAYEKKRKPRVDWIVEASDKPMRTISAMKSPLKVFLRNAFIRKKGPLNIQGWRQLLK